MRKLTVKGDDDVEKQIAMARIFNVFNAAQVDGLSQEAPRPLLSEQQRDTAALRFIKATEARIMHGGDRAYYSTTMDMIGMPEPVQFKTYEDYLTTSLHELCHWSAAKHRLNRDLSGRFKTRSYAAEELIAELGAAFLCAHLEMQGKLRHSEYIANWLELFRDGDKAILTAASKASQAAEYLRSFSEQVAEAA
jgi:antirestriction protein ArdC